MCCIACCVSQAANVTFIDENCAHFYHYAQRLIDAEYTAELTATSRCRPLNEHCSALRSTNWRTQAVLRGA